MSFFDRLRSFTEGEDIFADDFETEFDAVSTALNRLLPVAGWLAATGGLKLKTEFQTVPGCEKAISVGSNSTILAVGTANLPTKAEAHLSIGTTTGTTRAPEGERATASAVVGANVGVGTYTLRMQATSLGAIGAPELKQTDTGVIYVVLPRV